MFIAGRARHRITIERRNITRNAIGENVEDWVTHAQCWAIVNQTRAREAWKYGADQFVNSYPTSFEIRYRSDITTEMRISWLDRTFRIESVVDPGQRRQSIVIDAVEVEEAIA